MQLAQFPKVATRGSFYLLSPLPPSYRDQPIPPLKIGFEEWHILNVWALHRNFYQPESEKRKAQPH